jgi:hypothetical protein
MTYTIHSISSINNQIGFIFKRLLPVILVLVLLYFVLGLQFNRKNNNESWINYMNVPFGEVQTGADCPVAYYKRIEYRKPYRYPLGIKQSYPFEHIAPIMM